MPKPDDFDIIRAALWQPRMSSVSAAFEALERLEQEIERLQEMNLELWATLGEQNSAP